jgi:dihydrolipoamide dehydrogenase
MSDQQYDLIVIGAGPGGYVAAIRGAQLGMKVAVVELREALGGVCLNEGCIPSKALLDSSELFALARDKFAGHGILVEPPRLDLARMMARKRDVVKKLTDGVAFLFKKNGVAWVRGAGKLARRLGYGGYEVEVTAGDSVTTIEGKRVLLATGSTAATVPGLKFDGRTVVSAREALSFTTVPEHLLVVGGGYIGLELGSVWRRLGATVTVVDILPKVLPNSDGQVADTLVRSLKKQGITFRLGTKVEGVSPVNSRVKVTLVTGDNREELICDKILVAAGRKPLTAGLGLEEAGVKLDAAGRVVVDENCQTTATGIYAIGDLIPGPMLAHKASEEGVVAVERMTGEGAVVEYNYIPGVVYTWPEAASVGQTEEQLKENGVTYDVGRFNFMGNGRARAMDETEGFVKVLAEADTGKILGVHIIGPRASDLIAEAVTVMAFEGTAEDIALICHAHPTLSEAVKEAALDVLKRAVHS